MRTISVAALRQNPTEALDAAEHGETLAVTRYRREIARLTPAPRRTPVSGIDAMRIYRLAPLADTTWEQEVTHDRAMDAGRDLWA